MKIYSTLDRKVVPLDTINKGVVSMYNCGPTVYYRMHVGNCRAYLNWDILHRSLLYLGYEVDRIMNFTDVGHMTEDEDFGEDKLEVQANKSGTKPIDIADKYIKTVLEDFHSLNMLSPSGDEVDPNWDVHNLEQYGWLRATDYVDAMIKDIQKMEERGYTYETDKAVYFDITKVSDYTIFTGQDLEDKQVAVREDVQEDIQKKHPADFVLWMKRVGKYANHSMHWDSPWGDGFPGWHIECSSMGMSKFGTNFDIHTGGIDHIPVHHANERAQNIGICGQPVVKYWVHNEFLVGADNGKLSKSLGNAITAADLAKLGVDPMDLRYLVISANYRVKLQFSEQALKGARSARLALMNRIKNVKESSKGEGNILSEYVDKFKSALEDNLNMSEAFAILNDMLKSDNKPEDILVTVYDFDKVLGLRIRENLENKEDIPSDIQDILDRRAKARENKEYAVSDELRDLLLEKGYQVLDTSQGQILTKRNE